MKRLLDLIKSNESLNRFIEDNRSQLKKVAVVSALIIVALAVYSFGSSSKTPEITEESKAAEVEEYSSGTIFVDIGGAVASPKLAELPDGSRVEDAIQAAGGITEDADMININRAEFLEDGQKIFIPSASSVESSDSESPAAAGNSQSNSGTTSSGKVNINYADSETLQTLTGVGPATADKIITYREKTGRFKTIEELKNVSGIGDKTFEKLKDDITV